MTVDSAIAAIRHQAGLVPDIGIVLGSGLGGLADAVTDATVIPYAAIPGFPGTGVGSHKGQLVLGRLGGRAVAMLQGRAHYYEGGRADAMAVPVRALAGLGCRILLLTNAAGSLRRGWPPGTPVVIADHINLTGQSPLFGATGDRRFVDMVDAYDPALRATMRAAAKRLGQRLGEGVYAWASGPQFETPAEIRAMRMLGADLVGMSTVPEVILARHAGLRVAALSMVTNLAAGMADGGLGHAQTLAAAQDGAGPVARLVTAFLEDLEG